MGLITSNILLIMIQLSRHPQKTGQIQHSLSNLVCFVSTLEAELSITLVSRRVDCNRKGMIILGYRQVSLRPPGIEISFIENRDIGSEG